MPHTEPEEEGRPIVRDIGPRCLHGRYSEARHLSSQGDHGQMAEYRHFGMG